jgi:L,D-transpeptidase YcbB
MIPRSPLARFAILATLILAACALVWGALNLPGRSDRAELRRALESREFAFMEPAYAARGFVPIWLDGRAASSSARELVQALDTSARDGLSPAAYGASALKQAIAAPSRSRGERIRTELLLSSAYVRYVRDLHSPAPGADLAYTDPQLQPAFRDPARIIGHLAAAPSTYEALVQATRMNDLYVQMRAAIARYRAAGHRGDGRRDPAVEALLLLNLDRLRALPGELGERFVLVDAASSRLWLYEDGQPVGSMKAIAGAADEQTPQMAALIRYAIFNPVWNVPPDLARKSYAVRIGADRALLSRMNMDAWSDFTARGVRLDPGSVDWSAVARGQEIAWLRQRPGPHNAMGTVKFMLPNELGIYLHDTPGKALFDHPQRHLSAGCVRVEDADRLRRWLFRGLDVGARGPEPEQRFDLAKPVPVYIVYLTAIPEGDAVRMQKDVYGRDAALFAARLVASGSR